MTLPGYTFAWVNETDTTFNPSTMNVFDENVLSFDIEHEEGQTPTLEITIKNPRIGLLSPGRKVWAWFAWQSPADDPDYAGALVPLFFGVLIGVPTSLFKETITLKFIARSPTYIADKQAVAETMKVFPYYDPYWFDPAHRDDPDSILEGWSALWHIDRTSLATTASDVLEGEDGTLTFTEDVALYDSVEFTLGQPPLTNVRVQATCNWTQKTSGFFAVPTVNVLTYTGDSFMGDWPKAGASIGGGYTVESSFVIDTYHVSQTPTTSYNSSWTNPSTDLGQCSNQSSTTSSSGPALLSPDPLTAVLTGEFTSGVCFPDSDPPQNIPAKTSVTGIIVPLWAISATMSMRYDASRQYSEVLVFDMTASTQAILTSPTVAQHTELITISSIDLSKPLEDLEAWTDFEGKSVGLAQIIYPNNPTTPGGLSYQICITPGTAGTVEPEFSDFAGVTTTDGSVTWASLGQAGLTDTPAWSGAAFVPLGQIILMTDRTFNPASGQYEVTPNTGSFFLCTTAGRTNSVYTDFTYVPPVQTNDAVTPAPVHISDLAPPAYSTAVGTHIVDGSVVWTVLGTNPPTISIPIGGGPGNVTANNYFPTARGQQSVQFLISKARAVLRYRARAVQITWNAPFRYGVALSCRKNATIFDPRFPGGAANGKVIKYNLTGSEGLFLAKVQVGCAIGLGEGITEIVGTPEYVNAGYVEPDDYQVYDGQTIASGSADVTYTPPVYSPFDDGMRFPLRWQDISDGGTFSGDIATQKAAIIASFGPARVLAYAQKWAGQPFPSNSGGNGATTTVSGLDPSQAWQLEEQELALASQLTPYVMAANPIAWTALLLPCSGSGPFEGAYAITVSPLVIPQGINLEAPSSP